VSGNEAWQPRANSATIKTADLDPLTVRDLRPPALILSMTLVGIGLSAVILFAAMPPIITQAYRGESLPMLDAMIRGQAVHPVEHYLRVWRDLSLRILTVEVALGLVLALLSWSPLQRVADRVLGAPVVSPRDGARSRMTRGQLIVANCVVFALVGAQLVNIGLQREDWPFSNYPMYSGEQTDQLRWIRLYGVAQAGEFPLTPERQLRPFDSVRVHHSLGQLLTRADDATATRRALQNLHALYERGRRAGEHTGPPIQALRLYRVSWHIEPGLTNRSAPEERELLYELRIGD
jgi:hypothetical protein